MRLLLWRRSFVAFIHVLYLYAGRHIPGVCVVFFFSMVCMEAAMEFG